MSSLLDVPAQLALVLSLAASTVANEPPAARPAAESPLHHQVSYAQQPLEGPFAFGEAVWLRALKEGPAQPGAPGYQQSIFKTSGGRYYVPASDTREAILAKRFDAATAEQVARALALDNARALKSLLQRAPSAGELYIAHVVGSEGAARIIALTGAKPGEGAVKHFPELAAAVPPVARGATLAELYARICDRVRERAGAATPMLDAEAPPAPAAPPNLKPTTAGARHPQPIAWSAEVSTASTKAFGWRQ